MKPNLQKQKHFDKLWIFWTVFFPMVAVGFSFEDCNIFHSKFSKLKRIKKVLKIHELLKHPTLAVYDNFKPSQILQFIRKSKFYNL